MRPGMLHDKRKGDPQSVGCNVVPLFAEPHRSPDIASSAASAGCVQAEGRVSRGSRTFPIQPAQAIALGGLAAVYALMLFDLSLRLIG